MTKRLKPVGTSLRQFTATILRDVGLLLHIPGIMALLSLPVCLLAGEFYAVGPFLLAAGLSFAIGQGLYRGFQQAGQAKLRHAVITVALGWGLIPFLGAVPILGMATASQAEPSVVLNYLTEPLNALFEAFSGFTSTGLTVVLDASQIPHSLQWWRSFMEWIGGVGVIVLMVSVLEPSTDPYQLYSFEGRQKLIGLTLRETAQSIWWIYCIYTLGSIILFRILGMSWWPALNHGMTAISTGGFSITGDSIQPYSPTIQIGVIAVMVMGAISFQVHARLLRQRRFRLLWQDAQHRLLWLLLGFGGVLLVLEKSLFIDRITGLQVLFQWTSALTTCGFAVADESSWSISSKLLLTIAMLFGGAAGSTTGGLKLKRVASLFKGISWRFQRLALLPHQMMRHQLQGDVITESEANRRVEAASVLGVLWVSLIVLGVVILLHVEPYQYTLADTLFEAASAMGSAGLSVGITHPELNPIGRVVLILFMWMGRLEIIPVLALIVWPATLLKRRISRLWHALSN